MITIATYPPVPATLSGNTLTADRFLQNPNFVARRMQTLGDLRYIGTRLLTGRQETNGGAVGYEQIEGIFADAAPEIVAPGAEYTMTTIADGAPGIARVAKWGKDTEVTDESIKRRNMDPVNKGLGKLVNSAALVIDQACTSVVASAITNTRAAEVVWTDAAPKVLRDILRAASDIRSLNLGYEADVLLVPDSVWAYLASDTVIAAAMARETANNPIASGRFSRLAGLDVVPVPSSNLPGGAGTAAWLLDSTQLGFIATEDLGGGYQQAGELVQTKVMREDSRDLYRLRARANFVPVVTDPGAGFKITGVSA